MVKQMEQIVDAANRKLEAQATQHEAEVDALRIEMGKKIAAAVEAAAPCAKSEWSTNGDGDPICTMKVDQVQSLRGDN